MTRKRILAFLREAGVSGVRHNELTRKAQFVEPRLRREIIQSLLESEQIVAHPMRSRGRTAVLYRVAS